MRSQVLENAITFIHQFCNFRQDMLSEEHLGRRETLQELCWLKVDRAGHRIMHLEVDVSDIAPSGLIQYCGPGKVVQ